MLIVPKITACNRICVGDVCVGVLQHRRKVSGKVATPRGQKGNAFGNIDHLIGDWRQCYESKIRPGQWLRNSDKGNVIRIVLQIEVRMEMGLVTGSRLATRIMRHCIESQMEHLAADRTTGGSDDPYGIEQGSAANG